MSRLCLIAIAILLLTACTVSASTTATPSRQSSTLAQIDLEALVIQSGDLPPMEAAPEKIFIPLAGNRPGIAMSFARLLKKGDTVFGSIYVDIYTDTTDAKKVYDVSAGELRAGSEDSSAFKSPSIGDEAVLWAAADGTFVYYRYCHAYINISLPASEEATLTYAKRLDARLMPLVCP